VGQLGGAATWRRLARKCQNSCLAEFLGGLATDEEDSPTSACQIPEYRFEDGDLAERVGAIISNAALNMIPRRE